MSLLPEDCSSKASSLAQDLVGNDESEKNVSECGNRLKKKKKKLYILYFPIWVFFRGEIRVAAFSSD